MSILICVQSSGSVDCQSVSVSQFVVCVPSSDIATVCMRCMDARWKGGRSRSAGLSEEISSGWGMCLCIIKCVV
ncbi:hypothetical protein BRADI_1g18476v3 [Brachypodium distachyon]|uniref:Uncharacterized protein n=1 Tax=Brachypodium distachyon TaxID=15368 RepID=A0A0Q3NCQ0_BRADI|nr:hypothetical protein BRADI_1g18476v3 [Brachypodium distachyon]